MNCIIIDDEPLARQELEALINEVSSLDVIAKFSSALKALEFLANNTVDLIFLDIEMPHLNGIDFVKKIPPNIHVIFTTAYAQYALKSYELDVVDYLLKPIDSVRLDQAIKRAIEYNELFQTYHEAVEESVENYLFIKAERRFYKIFYTDILFIEGLKDYVIVHTSQQKLITALNLKTIAKKLPSNCFIRISKSYIVNINAINSFDTHNVYIQEHEIPLGEVYKKNFIEAYSNGTINI